MLFSRLGSPPKHQTPSTPFPLPQPQPLATEPCWFCYAFFTQLLPFLKNYMNSQVLRTYCNMAVLDGVNNNEEEEEWEKIPTDSHLLLSSSSHRTQNLPGPSAAPHSELRSASFVQRIPSFKNYRLSIYYLPSSMQKN